MLASLQSQVEGLVQAYELNRAEYESPSFRETQLRVQFVNPLFQMLGWDVANAAGRFYPDVMHEYALRMQETIKAPDYAFMVGPARKFFVEAKKPSVDITSDPAPAFQLRLYAWSAKLPVSVLTNFRQLTIYDTRIEPAADSVPSDFAILSLTLRDYLLNWDQLANVISREAVWKGSIDRLSQTPLPKNARPVDEAFLLQLEQWREQIALEIAKTPGLRLAQIRTATQLIVDRLLFLRICESSGLDIPSIRDIVSSESPYERFIEICRIADKYYNSGLFHFTNEPKRNTQPDLVTPGLHFSGQLFKKIVASFYEPAYIFSALPVEIIGQAYERFLGSRIERNKNTITIATKPEVRKAGGVYYTPEYIVDYIVAGTIGQDFTPQRPLTRDAYRVLDPACGSGSFLLGAYKFMLNWYLNKYVRMAEAGDNKKVEKQIYPVPNFEGDLFSRFDVRNWRLTIAERKRILLNHIFGVDVDPQAVEVTKLSLLLCCLENETASTIGQQLSFIRDRVLPDLDNNIQSGNSLVGVDFFRGQPVSMLDMDRFDDVNPFDWPNAFPAAAESGGFHSVIGNPPYVYVGDSAVRDYMLDHSRLQEGKPDLYRFFIEKGLGLTRKDGRFSFIIPTAFFDMISAAKLRRHLLDNGLADLTFIDGQVFLDAGVNSSIFVVRKGDRKSELLMHRDDSASPSESTLRSAKSRELSRSRLLELPDARITWGSGDAALEHAFQDTIPLGQIANYTLGMQVYHNTIHTPDEIESRIFHRPAQELDFEPESNGKNVKRYVFREHFASFVRVTDRCYHKPAPEFFHGERILVREIVGSNSLVCCYSNTPHISTKALIIVKPKTSSEWDVFSLLAVLNSRPIGAYIRARAPKGDQRLFPRISLSTIRSLPIPNVSPDERLELSKLAKEQTEIARRNANLQDQTTMLKLFESNDTRIDEIVSAALK